VDNQLVVFKKEWFKENIHQVPSISPF